MLLHSFLAVRFLPSSSTALSFGSQPRLSYHETSPRRGLHFTSRRRSNCLKSRVRRSSGTGAAEQSPVSIPPEAALRSYHPLEEIGEVVESGDAKPTPAEIARTLIEVNGKATLMFTGMMDDQFHDSVYWPDLAYLTDEHGNMYFEMKDDEDVLQTLTSENNYVQVVIGLDTFDMLNEMELGPSDIDFGFEEIMEGVSDDDEYDIDESDDYENDWIVLDDEEDDMDPAGAIGDWSKLATTRSSHPVYFAKKLAEAALDNPVMNYMDQPPPGLCIQGPLQPAFIEESSVIRKRVLDREYPNNDDTNGVEKVSNNPEDWGINGHDLKSGFTSAPRIGSVWAEEMDKSENLRTGSSFYKLEMIKIQLISPHRDRAFVEINDFQKAKPDAIAHSTRRIISHLKAGGEKFIQALKSLCWRVKSIQVEEAILTGVDSLGFDLRVCSGKEVQNLRFAFVSKANSEYSAERQLHDLIYPRIHQNTQRGKKLLPRNCDC